MSDVWLPIPGQEGRFDVSDFGQIRSKDRIVERRDGRKRIAPGRILKTTPKVGQYRRVRFERAGKSYLVHRIVASVFVPNPLNLPMVNHKDLDKANCAAVNLEWCTRSQNGKHAFLMGALGAMSGDSHPRTKIKRLEALAICKEHDGGATPTALADRYGVTSRTISRVVKSWRLLNV